METIISLFNLIGIDFNTFWKAGLVLLLGTILLSVIGRFAFGKRSVLNHAVSSAIGILCIFAITVALRTFGTNIEHLIAPLPFVSIDTNTLTLFSFQNAHYTIICGEVLNMIILAFLVNLADNWMPAGKNILTWLIFRIITVVIAYILHLVVVGLLATYLPEGILTYAPVVLLAILLLLLLTGAFKIVIGALISTVNPIIGALYTFFFANIIGKQITKAVLTTLILAGMVIGLQSLGIHTLLISASALVAYLPLLIILIVLWFIVFKIF